MEKILEIKVAMYDMGGDGVDIKIESEKPVSDLVMAEILSKMVSQLIEKENK